MLIHNSLSAVSAKRVGFNNTVSERLCCYFFSLKYLVAEKANFSYFLNNANVFLPCVSFDYIYGQENISLKTSFNFSSPTSYFLRHPGF